MKLILVLICLVLISPLPEVLSARILGMFLLPAPSHHLVAQSVLKAMVEAGHEVVAYTPIPLKNPPPNYINVFLEEFLESEDAAIMQLVKVEYKKCSDAMGPRVLESFEKFINNKIILSLLASKEKFDLVVVEPFMIQEFTLILGHVFNAPVIGISAFPSYDFLNNIAGSPLAVASVPDYCSPRTDQMSFTDRFLNAYHIFRRLYLYYNHNLPGLDAAMRVHFPDMPSVLEMAQNVSVMFVNEHPIAAYPRPRTPNVVPIAGIHLRPPLPLPQDIQKFMDEATKGVIFFSLGTCVPEETHSAEFFSLVLDVFKELKQRILWKTKRRIENLPSHIMTSPWLPQQDILAHHKCVLFITHGGVNSVTEAVHFGVPVIGIPHFSDQRFNTMFTVARDFGRAIELADLSRERLAREIRTVLEDSRFAKSVAKFSAISRDRAQTPAQSVMFWTNHILRHGGSHLRSPPLPLYQIYLLDLLGAVVITSITVAVGILILFYKLFRRFTSLTNPKLNAVARKKEK